MAETYNINGTITFAPAPEGYVCDFENPQQRLADAHYAIFTIGGLLALMALFQRFYVKLYLSAGIGADDIFIVLAWIASNATQIPNVWAISIPALGVHTWELSTDDYMAFSAAVFASAPIYMLCNGFAKMSLLCFYQHLSPQTWFRFSVWAIMAVVLICMVIITLALIFACHPVSLGWDITVEGGYCVINTATLYIATSVVNIVTDIALFVLPIRMVLGTRMSRPLKIGAIIVFAIGSLTVATSVVRLAYLLPLLESTDQPWDTAPANIWVMVEANLFIICGSFPTIRRFFKHVAPRLMRDPSSRRTEDHDRQVAADSGFDPHAGPGPSASSGGVGGVGGSGSKLNRPRTRTTQKSGTTASSSTASRTGGNMHGSKLARSAKILGLGQYSRFDSDDDDYDEGDLSHSDEAPAVGASSGGRTRDRSRQRGGGGGGRAAAESYGLGTLRTRPDIREDEDGHRVEVTAADDNTSRDDNSDKAIIQTRTYAVQFD